MCSDSSKRFLVHISLGSNVGDGVQNCIKGLKALTASGKTTLIERSPFYKTEPQDYTDQDWFVNCAAKLSTLLDPPDLLIEMKSIEKELGRTPGKRFGPRKLDMDIILFGKKILETEFLTIPHPRMHKRHFVLKPLCDIDPEMIHPKLELTVKELLENLEKTGQRIELHP